MSQVEQIEALNATSIFHLGGETGISQANICFHYLSFDHWYGATIPHRLARFGVSANS